MLLVCIPITSTAVYEKDTGVKKNFYVFYLIYIILLVIYIIFKNILLLYIVYMYRTAVFTMKLVSPFLRVEPLPSHL